jgi:hypothetical protein
VLYYLLVERRMESYYSKIDCYEVSVLLDE